MSDEGFKALQVQAKELGMAYWACKSCLSFAQKMNHSFKEMTKKMDELTDRVEANEKRIGETENGLEDVKKGVKKVGESVETAIERAENGLYEELKERESKRTNLLLHGVEEPARNITGNRERMEDDLRACERIFKEAKARTKRADIKFCRRIGERGEKPRPMVVGLKSEEEKRHVLDCARTLKDTTFDYISIVPDLTLRQRREETELEKEAERRNKNLTEEDRSKNWKWLVVGRKGEKRLIKGTPREFPPRAAARRREAEAPGKRGRESDTEMEDGDPESRQRSKTRK